MEWAERDAGDWTAKHQENGRRKGKKLRKRMQGNMINKRVNAVDGWLDVNCSEW